MVTVYNVTIISNARLKHDTFLVMNLEQKVGYALVVTGILMISSLVTMVNAQTTEQFLDEDQSMVCKHEKHLGTVDSNALICVTVQDDQMIYDIFERLIIDDDTYEFD